MVSPISNDAVGFAPLAPPTVWQGWDAFVHRAPTPARDADDPAWSQAEREDYRSELAVMRTPAMDSVFTAVHAAAAGQPPPEGSADPIARLRQDLGDGAVDAGGVGSGDVQVIPGGRETEKGIVVEGPLVHGC